MEHQVTYAAGRTPSPRRLARRLGWMSIGLGVAELLWPRATARAAGMPGAQRLVRGAGLREIATGVGILSSRNPAPWMWARVGGDIFDLASVGTRKGVLPRAQKTTNALAAVAAVTALDVACARALESEAQRGRALTKDYRLRSGLPKPPDEMRGAAREDFVPPASMRTPPGMRPYAVSREEETPR